jgi:prevent-host-death family protein
MMKTITVPKSKFKPKAFEYLRCVEAGDKICITDHGKPVVDLQPHGLDDDELLQDMRNLVVRYDNPLDPVEDVWDVES